jgi:hypothetical protein
MKPDFNTKGNTMKTAAACLALILVPLVSAAARADEALFGYVYTADTLPKGKWEYEQWNTVRTGKSAGSYTAFDLRNELEHGFTDRFSASFYLNSMYHYVHNVPDDEDTTANLPQQNSFDISGVSVEMKYQVLSPYKDPLGFTLYLEPELSVMDKVTGEPTIERALEGKLIFQKNFLEDRFVWAANFTAEPEWEIEGDERKKELACEMTTGLSYRFAPNWYGGLEFRNHREFANFEKQEHQASFLGPNVHYGGRAWWATLSILPQIAGSPTFLGFDANGNAIENSPRHLAEHEKLEIRLRFGYNFG